MPNFCIVAENNIIENIIVAASADVFPGITLLETYEGAEIGAEYRPPHVPTDVELLHAENKVLRAQVDALSEQNDFHEDLIVDLANVVYA